MADVETAPMTLAEALAYLKPDPANNGTISLRAPKAYEAVERIEREFVRLDAIITDKVADTRLVHMGPRGDGFGIDLREGPIPYLCEYLAQFMGHGSDDPLSNYAEIEVQHHEIGAMTLTIQRRAGKTPHQIAVAAAEEAKRLREEIAALRSKDREDGAREMREDQAFAVAYTDARGRMDYERMARVLSGRLRRMDRRSAAANQRADQAEQQLRLMRLRAEAAEKSRDAARAALAKQEGTDAE